MIEEYFGTVSGEDDWNPRYNIAPTQSVPVIRQNPKEPHRELSLLRWGLIPSCNMGKRPISCCPDD
jgi:putative SOS response-associated peptidase YedK